jgi:hypothetical protein
MKMVRQKCDPKMVKEFGDSRLSADFAKPAQPALVNAGVQSVRDVAQKTAGEIAGLHGLGPSAMPPAARGAQEAPVTIQACHSGRLIFALYSPAFDSVIIRTSHDD